MSTSRQLLATNDIETNNDKRDIYNQSLSVGQLDTQNSTQTLGTLILRFTTDELCSYVDARLIGLAETSRDWIIRSASTLWRITQGEISQITLRELRVTTLTRYTCEWSHVKMLSFAKAFLKHLTKMRLDTRYLAFDMFLERSKKVKTRKAVTSRIITQADIEKVLAYIEHAKREGRIKERRALEYTAFVVFGAVIFEIELIRTLEFRSVCVVCHPIRIGRKHSITRFADTHFGKFRFDTTTLLQPRVLVIHNVAINIRGRWDWKMKPIIG